MLSFYHERADVHFSWDGWMQIMVRPGEFAPREAFTDRFDIREPDLTDRSRHSMYPADGSVHLVPETQEAFEVLCDTWWRGAEICVGVRDYAEEWISLLATETKQLHSYAAMLSSQFATIDDLRKLWDTGKMYQSTQAQRIAKGRALGISGKCG